MRSKTSFFNRTLCFSAIRRFWPLWGTYLGIWILSLPLPILQARRTVTMTELEFIERVYNLAHIEGLILAAVFSVFSAMAVWSFLYNARSASGFGCLPVRREGQFFSALLAGFLPLVASNLLAALLTLLVAPDGPHALVLGQFFAIVTLIDLFFYGFATLCAQLTGHILVLPAVYGVLNFVAIAVEVLLREVLGNFVYGMSGTVDGSFSTLWLTPALAIGSQVRVNTEYAPAVASGSYYAVSGPNSVSFTGWWVLLVYALAGLVCMALALLLFRRRKLESAGDVVAVGFLRPVFRWCMALGCGLCLSTLMEFIIFTVDSRDATAFRILLIFFLLGAFIGWFAGEMLIRKSFRVFKKRAWGGFGICCAVILFLMLGMRYDLFGYEKRVPKTENVVSATVYAGSGGSTVLKEAENLEKLTDLHRAIVADKNGQLERFYAARSGSWVTLVCRIRYTLRSGRVMSRYYLLYTDPSDPSETASALQDLLNTPEAVASRCALELPAGGYDLDAYIVASMTVPECARAAGYADPEEYVLLNNVYSPEEVQAMSPEKRRQAVEKVLNSGNWDYTGWAGGEYTGPRDLEQVFTTYGLSLDYREAEELYRNCLLPDIREGSLGKVRLLSGKEEEGQYSVSIELTCYERKEDASGPAVSARTGWLEVSPGADSRLTNAWLEAHGVALHTVGEVNAAAGYETTKW